ncbi:cytochrome [Streptomyces sp. CB02488]|uniref:cytochrome P450 n=1 Tax=Streptomyces sp. CB02488 TaxID=1703920 RepID=UPI00093B2914|nr:cytochrome P450 [Streptomyces sp. CB02488]OKK13173.1 cytochrome [Streptomyces sp. CB02488]
MQKLPPGSRQPAFLQTFHMRNPVRYHEKLRRRHGPVFRQKLLGFPPQVVVTNPELAAQIWATDGEGNRAGALRARYIPWVGDHSLLTTDGEGWWRQRRLISPTLHGRSIAAYPSIISEIAARDLADWPLETPFKLMDRLQSITLDIALRLVFGVSEPGKDSALRTALIAFSRVTGSPALFLMPSRLRTWAENSPLAKRMAFLPSTRAQRASDAVDELLLAEIARRRGESDPDATDVLGRLLRARDDEGLGMTDQEIRDQLITLLEAGLETTATGLSWTFERLVRNPEAYARLKQEVERGEEEIYLDAVIKEALRARPVVFGSGRVLDQPVHIGEYDIPAGWVGIPMISLILSNDSAYPDPEEFRPERFIGEDTKAAQRSFLPFGGGRRYCVGAQLAMMEMKYIAREVVRHIDLAPARPAPEKQRMWHVSLIPGDRAAVVAHRKPPARAAATDEAATGLASAGGITECPVHQGA